MYKPTFAGILHAVELALQHALDTAQNAQHAGFWGETMFDMSEPEEREAYISLYVDRTVQERANNKLLGGLNINAYINSCHLGDTPDIGVFQDCRRYGIS